MLLEPAFFEEEEEEESKDPEPGPEQAQQTEAEDPKEKRHTGKEHGAKMGIHGAFRFHSVGQGLFYSGILSKGRRTFSFVYDCGSISRRDFLRREIEDFKLLLPDEKDTKNKRLDLLVISHLHDDHVNGLASLLKDVKIDTVVMPYTHDGLKFLARLESDGEDIFLQEFYADPVGWFVSKGVRRILLVGSPEREQGEGRGPNRQERPVDERPENGESSLFLLSSPMLVENFDGTEVRYFRNDLEAESRYFDWEFTFENLKLSDIGDKYIEVIEGYKNKKCLTLEQILASRTLRAELKRKLREAIGENYSLNRTSVVLLHRPAAQNVHVIIGLKRACADHYRSTVLTGDIELKEDERLGIIESDLKPYFIIQYPHHGARGNHDAFSSQAEISVLSYGLTNRYGHPHIEVLNDLDRRFTFTAFVNEREAFDYQIICE